MDLSERLSRIAPLVLDGATGTELERRGEDTAPPLWSARALLTHPELVERIHADYVDAGAEALTANTFRTQRRSLARGGQGERAAELTNRAVALARSAARASKHGPVFVLGSAPTLEDCYRPDLVPGASDLAREHAEHAANLVQAGVDAILVETMNSVREARAAVRAARAAGATALVSFVCWRGAQLLSGESLAEALDATVPEGPAAVLVNCLPPSNVAPCLAVLRQASLPFGVYANLGEPADEGGFRRSEQGSPPEFAAHVDDWLDAGAKIVGGCCGTVPASIRATVQLVRNRVRRVSLRET